MSVNLQRLNQQFKYLKRSKLQAQMRQLFLIVGGFLILNAILATPSYARGGLLVVAPKIESPVDVNDKKINNLKATFKSKDTLVKEKADSLETLNSEILEITETKDILATEVTDMRSEVEALKLKLAEKKRLEAERIVNATKVASNSTGNTYAAGNCTWYVKSRRPDIPNRMGNANAWYASAQAQGFKTGTVSKKGAIGVSFNGWAGHVVYVEAWNPDGTVTVSEMNYEGLYSMTTRTVPESDFVYIYEKA